MPILFDQLHREINVPVNPQRIISLVPSQTELLHALGLQEEVIGLTKFCIHPTDWFKNKRRVGGTKKLNIKLIESLNPDLIIGNKEENTQEDIYALDKKYPVWLSDIYTLSDALEMIKQVGNLVNRGQNADLLVSQITEKAADFKPRKVFSAAYFIWMNPMMVAGEDTFIQNMLERAGFLNVFQDSKRYPIISEIELKRKKPEVILLSSEPFPFKEKHINYFKSLLPESQVVLVDGEMFSWYGSRLLQSFDYFKKLQQILE